MSLVPCAHQEGMGAEQYHNWLHAADVASRLSAILKMSHLCDNAGPAVKKEAAAALIACIIPGNYNGCRTS